MIHNEQTYLISNGTILYSPELREIQNGAVLVIDGKIKAIYKKSSQGEFFASTNNIPIINAKNHYVGPGFIDMHIHGCGGHDTGETDKKLALESMTRFLCERGITSFQPAVVPDIQTMSEVEQAIKDSKVLQHHVIGVLNEGPFISIEKKGGLPIESIKEYSKDFLEQLLSFKKGDRSLLTTMTFAPELEGAMEGREILESHKVKVAWGHSSSYSDMLPKVKGVHFTHLFNAMNGIDHKRPGLAMIPFLDDYNDSTCELIADTVHVNPLTMDFIFKNIGSDRVCIISDSMKNGGVGKGESIYLGREVVCDGMVSRYKDNNTLIGSAMMIDETASNLCLKKKINVFDLFKMISVNPAKVLGLKDRGAIEEDRRSDIVILDNNYRPSDVFTSCL